MDFSCPSADGDLPDDFAEWKRGLTCTVRPSMLAPLQRGRHYMLNVTVRHVATVDRPRKSFAELYARVTALIDARLEDLACDGYAPRRWIAAQAWFAHQLQATAMHSASVTVGIVEPFPGHSLPIGERRPDAEALAVASGGSPEAFAAKHADAGGVRRLDEIIIDFEHEAAVRDVTISYGEYVPSCAEPGFAAIVARAEARARRYLGCAIAADARLRPPAIVRREWNCLETGKVDDARLASVHLFLRE